MPPKWYFEPKLKGALPADFAFGYASSAAQTEGAWDQDGRGPSIWDTFSQTPGRIAGESTPIGAARSYDLYREDVARMKAYGVTAYRFSLSWTRIIPLGGVDDPVNEAGLAHYDKVIDALIAAGIRPYVTLFHWDAPQALEDRYGGMLNKERWTADFVRYTRVCFARFGDRVRHWITYNDPGSFALLGYGVGTHAPGRKGSREPWIVGHTALVSHARVCEVYRQEFAQAQHGGAQVMMALQGNWSEPWDETDLRDREAAERARELEMAWFGDPLFLTGDYPTSMRAALGDKLPTFTGEERRLVLGSSPVCGLGSYTAFYVRHREGCQGGVEHNGNSGDDEEAVIGLLSGDVDQFDENAQGLSRGPKSGTDWLRTTPWGWAKTIRWMWQRYRMPIYITETGTTAPGEDRWRPPGEKQRRRRTGTSTAKQRSRGQKGRSVDDSKTKTTSGSKIVRSASASNKNRGDSDGAIEDGGDVLHDTFRIDFYRAYLTELAGALLEGVDIRGFFAWTLTDSWEWAAGQGGGARFGVTWVDFEDGEKTRRAKRSAFFVRDYFAHLMGVTRE